MNHFLLRASELEDEMRENRRWIHHNAEVGAVLPKTAAFVREKLRSYGYGDICEIGGGVVCTAGRGGRVILLRADMDALSQDEISGLPFACTDGACHSCGHDMHTTMLLAAAKMLKECETELGGTVKFMFQPGEEGAHGAETMINSGVLDNPHVDAALAMHCFPEDAGTAEYCLGRTRASIRFEIHVHGKSSHGATPHVGASALTAAAMIVPAAIQIPSMEVSSEEAAVLTFGTFHSGTADNINPNLAVMTGTIRVFKNELGEFIKTRLTDISRSIAAAFRCTSEIFFDTVPAFVNNVPLCEKLASGIEDVCGSEHVILHKGDMAVTDDFAVIGEQVPAMMFNIGMLGDGLERLEPHNPAIRFNENGLKYGAACYAECACRFLNS